MPGTQKSEQLHSTGSIEWRSTRHFSLRLSCRVCPVSTEQAELAGTVVNISRTEILVALDSEQIPYVLRPDDVVRVEVDLPRHPLFPQKCLECIVRVVRIVVAKAQIKVASQIWQMRVKDRTAKDVLPRDWFSTPSEGLIQ